MGVHLTSYHQTVLSHTSEKQKSKQGLWSKCHLRTRVYTLSPSPAQASQLYPQLQHACFLTANLTNAYQTARWHHIITWRQAWSHKGNRNDWGRCSLQGGVGNPSCHIPETADRLTKLSDPHIATELPHWNSLRATAVMLSVCETGGVQSSASCGFDVRAPATPEASSRSHVPTCRDNHTIEGGSPGEIQVEA